MKILLTGRNGQVGRELERSLASIGDVVAFDKQTLDLSNSKQIINRIREVNPDVIVNAAAYTAVDKAEKESDVAMAINGTAPGIIANEARRLGCLLVHYSTDYVFDGKKTTPYTEEDECNPLSVYGKTKLAGERAIQASGCRYLILRTAWVYASRGKNFLFTILRLANEKPELRIVNDQWGAPTCAKDIADATTQMLMHPSKPVGTYHLTASGKTTWCGFARTIVELSGLQSLVQPINTSEYPVAATRPTYSVLSNEKLHRNLGFSLPRWLDGLDATLAHVDGTVTE